MAESQLPFQPPLDVIKKIFRHVKTFYEQEPSAEPHRMIHQVFLDLENELNTDETQFGGFVSCTIHMYLDTYENMGDPDEFTDQQQRWLMVECPYFMQVHEALQLSQYYTGLMAQPATTSTMTQTDEMGAQSNDNEHDRHSESTLSADESELESDHSEAEDSGRKF